MLAADKLMASPQLYATFLLWLLSELFEELPEVGDPDKPKLVFFFDEAHLLFEDAPQALLEKIEQVVRLIRSKGVGVYFITQNPIDIPDKVGGQLGNRVQHALRAFTPRDQKAIDAAAETFRVNPGVDVATAITELKVGEALVSLLQPDGAPSPVERTLIKPPRSRLGPLTDKERAIIVSISPVAGKYDQAVDRESAGEVLKARARSRCGRGAAAQAQAAEDQAKAAEARGQGAGADRARAPGQSDLHGRGHQAVRPDRAAAGDQSRRGLAGPRHFGRAVPGEIEHERRSGSARREPLRELTLRGILLGGLITLLFTAANVYLGLKVGITFATSIPAAVISMAILRFVLEFEHPREQYRPDHRLARRGRWRRSSSCCPAWS